MFVALLQPMGRPRNSAVLARNFYGLLNVRELSVGEPHGRAYSLFHDQIVHGYQFRSEAKYSEPELR